MSGPVVLWDFEGTLAERPGRWSTCLLQCLAEVAGGEPTVGLDDIRPFLRYGYPWHRHDQGHEHLADPDAWWAELEVLFVAALRGAGVPPSQAGPAAGLMRHRFAEVDRWVVFSEARPALQAMAAAGWRNAIASNHVPELERLVLELGLSEHVDTVFTSAGVGWEKPNPEFFRRVVRAMGRPDRVWMVGDNPVADVRGAEAVGIPAVLVHTPPGVGLRQAVATILA
ncbi:HAD family hydrolase [Paractinoplanes toevensis]|uniref:HAD family hydrolase n=1 Tax=Paractinoplanes toevensis TaxID=571911 RepID=A0A919T8A4_9ACTN|nr:HAD family hydrolase [Actinoplanes toevensis]GIM90252.1 hypothetical protein Ato02nite_020450 [Actinoplanes toevensis]